MPTSRRAFLLGSAAAAIGAPRTLAATSRQFAYAGGYTLRPDGTAHGEGIYRFEADPRTGELMNKTLVAAFANPTWIAFHPSRRILYASSEMSEAVGGKGTIGAFAIDPQTGALTLLNTVPSEGAGTAYIATDRSGRFLFAANYGSGTFAVLALNADGSLGAPAGRLRDSAPAGKQPAASAPRGSYAISGHEGSRPHMIAPSPDNRFVLATDLGEDRIYVYRFDAQTGKLAPAQTAFVQMPSGDGPRHFVFHPNGRWFYSIQEEASTVAFFRYDAANGGLQLAETLSTLPATFAGTSYGSEIALSRDGRFLYCTNRLHDTVAIFGVSAAGNLKPLGEVSTMGDYPRHCAIDPSGRFLYVCAQRSDAITQFRIDRVRGGLTFTGHYTPLSAPAVLAFL